jgi:hypothetical protein
MHGRGVGVCTGPSKEKKKKIKQKQRLISLFFSSSLSFPLFDVWVEVWIQTAEAGIIQQYQC